MYGVGVVVVVVLHILTVAMLPRVNNKEESLKVSTAARAFSEAHPEALTSLVLPGGVTADNNVRAVRDML